MIVIDKASLVLEFQVTNEQGLVVTPISMKWSLVDETDAIVNARENVSVTPASTMSIVLTGNDTAYLEGNDTRKVLIEGTYLSTLGTLTVKKTVTFTVSKE